MISYAPYTLGKRKGALIRIGPGFADLHPWPELGDEPLDLQLKNFGKTRLSVQTIKHAALDGQAREKGKHLLKGLSIPKSHFLVTSDHIPTGWSHYKVKLEHIEHLEKIPGKVRIDCNGKLSLEAAKKLFEMLDPSRIDFVEDPGHWQELFSYGIPLAADRLDSPFAKVKIYKPAVEEKPITNRRVIVTSYLGHPLGQAIAAYYAAQTTEEVCGLLSHHAYSPNAYSEQLSQKGPTFMLPPGTGFGFDDLLVKEKWYALRLDL